MEGQPTQETFSIGDALGLQNEVFNRALELLPPKDDATKEKVYQLLLEAAGGIAAGTIIEKR
jgi:hypothetical protein